MLYNTRDFMLYLVFAILCSVTVAHILKCAGVLRLPIYAVYTANYAIASCIAIYGADFQLAPNMSWELGGIGIVLGTLFIGCFILFSAAIERLGVSLAVSLMRLAAVLPTLGSLLFFDAFPRPLQIAGIALAFSALPLANAQPMRRGELKAFFSTGFGWGLFLFFAFGVTEFLFKIQKELLPVANSYHFLVLVFPVAFLIGVGMMVKTGQKMNSRSLLLGSALGVVNFFSAYFFVLALKELPGVFAYPANGIAVILVTTLTGIILWKEKLTRKSIVFILMASAALVLINQ